MRPILPTSVSYQQKQAGRLKKRATLASLAFLILVFVFMFSSASKPFKISAVDAAYIHTPAYDAFEERKIPAMAPVITSKGSPKLEQEDAKIGWVTMLWGVQSQEDSLVRSVKSQERYAARHRYPFFLLERNLYNLIWSKPAMLLSVLLNERQKPEDQQLKWVVWTDADSVVMNPEVPIENLLPPSNLEDVQLITTSDIFGLNAGAMILRVSEFNIELLSRIIAYPGFHHDEHLDAAEQSALEKLILKDPSVQRKVVRMSQRYFNGYRPGMLEGQTTKYGNLMMHFPGGNKKEMGKYLDEVEGTVSKWSKPFSETEYPQAISAFWEEVQERSRAGLPLYAPLVRS